MRLPGHIKESKPYVAPHRGKWIARPKVHPYRGIRLDGWSGFGLVMSTSLVILVADLLNASWIRWTTYALVLGCWLLVVGHNLWSRRPDVVDQHLADHAFGEQHPVELMIFASGKSIGIDRGVVWFDDGLIGFSGAASSFVLAASDLSLQWLRGAASSSVEKMPRDAIRLSGAPVDAYVAIRPLFGSVRAYRKSLSRFIQEDLPTDAERHWPPLTKFEAGEVISRPIAQQA